MLRGLERRAAIHLRDQLVPLEDYLWRLAELSARCVSFAVAGLARVFVDERSKRKAH